MFGSPLRYGRRLLGSWRFRSGIALLLGIILVGMVVVQYERTSREQSAYSYLLRTNSWVSSQLQFELFRFLRSVDGFVFGEPTTTRDEMMLRFDLLWSRIPVFLKGPEAAEARRVPGAVELAKSLQEDLVDLESSVASLTAGDQRGRNLIVARLGRYHDALHNVTLEVAVGERRNEMAAHIEALGRQNLVFAGTVVTGGLLLVLFLLSEIRRGCAQAEREREAREMAIMANQAKSRFLANMSHELRTPLNAIIGFSEVMHEERLGPVGTPRYHDYLADIIASSHHLLTILNDVLDAARIEAGNLQLNEQEFNPGKEVRKTLRTLRPAADAKSIALVDLLDATCPHLYGDARLFRQICLNLVGNSLKFSPEGSRVNVVCTCERGRLLLVVDDNGPGIEENETKHVLNPFYQMDSDLNRRFEGCGLGLPLAKAYAELHGGSLAITSRVGLGTRVTVTFPENRLATGIEDKERRVAKGAA